MEDLIAFSYNINKFVNNYYLLILTSNKQIECYFNITWKPAVP